MNDLHIPDDLNPMLIGKPLYYNTYKQKVPDHLSFLDKGNFFVLNIAISYTVL